MKSEQKKKIEAQWQRLLSGSGESRKPASPAKSNDAPCGARVIRRRKGSRDVRVA